MQYEITWYLRSIGNLGVGKSLYKQHHTAGINAQLRSLTISLLSRELGGNSQLLPAKTALIKTHTTHGNRNMFIYDTIKK